MGQTHSGAEAFSINSIAHQTDLSKEQLADIHEKFMKIAHESPQAGDTVITLAQFQAVLLSTDIHASNKGFLEALFTAFDKNGDGLINFVEYCSGVSILLKGSAEDKFRLCFDIYDRNKSNQISKAEMLQVMNNMNLSISVADRDSRSFGDKDLVAFVDAIFAEYDKEHDDMLTYDEFLGAVKKYPKLVEFS